jgi:CheY-like chemotaxis protein
MRLKVDESKIKAEGSRFKCPKCRTILLVKRPAAVPKAALPKKELDKNKILVAHSNAGAADEITSILTQNGYLAVTSRDGIDAMIKATKELPFLTIVEVGLPKIFGFEVCKRLKQRAETKEMKFILIGAMYDQKRYTREPESLHGADSYIDEQRISELLIEKVNTLRGMKPEAKVEEKVEKPPERPLEKKPEQKAEPETKPEVTTFTAAAGDKVERARRLARAIVSDIYLYNTAKADESIMNDTFYSVFDNEIKEGLKLYKNRISDEVRAQGDYFKEAIDNFIANKKKGK